MKLKAMAKLPTAYGQFVIHAYTFHNGVEHIALVKGKVISKKEVLVRLHSSCITGDIFNSLRCDCGEQLSQAIKLIAKEKEGVIIYLQQEGRGIGITNKIKAYALQDQGMDTMEANVHLGFKPDHRDYKVGAQILRELGIASVRLLTNNPHKISDLKKYGLEITKRIPLLTPPNKENKKYLKTKKEKMGHYLR
ncbi:GTP cyclohydrolase II [Candidatus Woesearchaeota archaeon]|nr:GTP cyclohydrolase II [Candidatus Woesearchaeota archaeon]